MYNNRDQKYSVSKSKSFLDCSKNSVGRGQGTNKIFEWPYLGDFYKIWFKIHFLGGNRFVSIVISDKAAETDIYLEGILTKFDSGFFSGVTTSKLLLYRIFSSDSFLCYATSNNIKYVIFL